MGKEETHERVQRYLPDVQKGNMGFSGAKSIWLWRLQVEDKSA